MDMENAKSLCKKFLFDGDVCQEREVCRSKNEPKSTLNFHANIDQ